MLAIVVPRNVKVEPFDVTKVELVEVTVLYATDCPLIVTVPVVIVGVNADVAFRINLSVPLTKSPTVVNCGAPYILPTIRLPVVLVL